MDRSVKEAKEELRSLKTTTEKTVESSRNDIKELNAHVGTLNKEVNGLTKKRDELLREIQTEKADHQQELQVRVILHLSFGLKCTFFHRKWILCFAKGKQIWIWSTRR